MVLKNYKKLFLTIGLFVFLIAFIVLFRVLRDAGFISFAPNVSPVAAVALFGGILFPRKFAVVLPLVAMAIADSLIGFYSLPVMISVYGSFALIALLGTVKKFTASFATTIITSFSGAVLFYLITNAAVWLFSTMYAPTLSGLIQSYIMGLPFLRFTLFGDLLFISLLYGVYAFARVHIEVLDKSKQLISRD